jgi:ubiquinone/menaquinone biosynthesis C-methylase UbiE
VAELFDSWPEKYDQWFETPMGRLIEGYEAQLVLDLLEPGCGDFILDAGCGTGIFTRYLLKREASVVGLELSFPMLLKAASKYRTRAFLPLQGDMQTLPFGDASFDKVVSLTALEFIQKAKVAVEELFRIAKPGGIIVVATLNSLSPWADRRKEEGKKGHAIFRHTVFRSPEEVAELSPVEGIVQTAIHFRKEDTPEAAQRLEMDGQKRGLNTGAFVAVRWIKPR